MHYVSVPSAGMGASGSCRGVTLGSSSCAGQGHSCVSKGLALFVPFHSQGRGAGKGTRWRGGLAGLPIQPSSTWEQGLCQPVPPLFPQGDNGPCGPRASGRCRSCGKWHLMTQPLLSELLGPEGEGACLPGLARTRRSVPRAEARIQLLLCSQAGPPETQPLRACLWLHQWMDSVCCVSPTAVHSPPPMQTCAHTSPW